MVVPYECNDACIPNGDDDFYGVINPCDLAETEDSKPVDGVVDEVELKR